MSHWGVVCPAVLPLQAQMTNWFPLVPPPHRPVPLLGALVFLVTPALSWLHRKLLPRGLCAPPPSRISPHTCFRLSISPKTPVVSSVLGSRTHTLRPASLVFGHSSCSVNTRSSSGK